MTRVAPGLPDDARQPRRRRALHGGHADGGQIDPTFLDRLGPFGEHARSAACIAAQLDRQDGAALQQGVRTLLGLERQHHALGRHRRLTYVEFADRPGHLHGQDDIGLMVSLGGVPSQAARWQKQVGGDILRPLDPEPLALEFVDQVPQQGVVALQGRRPARRAGT